MSTIILRARALLLDMDGTLVKSTAGVETVWRIWCCHHGLAPEPVLAMCHGVRAKEVIEALAPQLDIAQEMVRLDELELAHAGVAEPVEGARALLHDLPADRWALVTSASKRVAQGRLADAGLPQPGLMIGGDDVVRGKPDPEPYLLAASRLGLDPADCLVFEDAQAGIASALQAGCQVVQIGGERLLDARVSGWLNDWRPMRVTEEVAGLLLSLPNRLLG
ncbi:HAD-IA family hydrolase [Aeromonas sp. MR16]|uniref:HAD-IA family hydrolase n=1 Tax=Aeromonas sp. MR16 TaxID=2923420 RepID=UPI001F4B45A2|nr:HAD-IA family hydrolase [Aeromonas sp. MR16]MCH7372776.1 HAD-IA family hydrolase [Aeromonas sp. MR16]